MPSPQENERRAPREGPSRTARSRGVVAVKVGRAAARTLLAAALFLVFGELAARVTGLVDRLGVHPLGMYVEGGRPDLPYRLRPGFRGEPPRTRYPIRVNALGLRGPEADALPRPGWRRLLVLGDSVAHGHGLREENAFPTLLGEELAQRGIERVEVLNGGTSGWDTAAEAAFLEGYGLALAPSIVVLTVSLNDYVEPPELTRLGALTEPVRRGALDTWLAGHSHLYVVLRNVVERLRAPRDPRPRAPRSTPAASAGEAPQRVARPAAARPRARRRTSPLDAEIAGRHARFYRAPSDPAWSRVRDALARIAHLTSAHGVALEVVIFPESFQFDAPRPNRDPQRAWLALCDELALDCFDLWPAFAAASPDPGSELFSDVQHPNVAGYAVAARALAEHLAARLGGAGAAAGGDVSS